MKNSTIQKLLKISNAKKFAAGEYICHEGEIGEEMYIVLSGAVGIYISSPFDDVTKVDAVAAGGFFGEMSVFDNGPRDATCVAEEDTICISINKNNLQVLIENCPDITQQILINQSTTIRELNSKLFKTKNQVIDTSFRDFSIPPLHKPHMIKEKEGHSRFLSPMHIICPICKRNIVVYNIKFHALSCLRVRDDLRHIYKDFDILWHYIWSCSECGYSNYFSEFFADYHIPPGEMIRILNEQKHFRKRHYISTSPFDELLFDYFKAIHLNECLYFSNTLLLGKLWLCLFWLYSDAGDYEMANYCRKQALDYYRKTYEVSIDTIQTEDGKQKCALIIAELYLAEENFKQARNYYNEVLRFPGDFLQQQAHDKLYELRDKR